MALSIDLNDDEMRRLSALSDRTGRPIDALVHEAITHQLEELEEIAWAEKAASAWLASDKKTRPLGEIRRELGL